MSLRIGGLATGMDMEGIVRDMMKVQQLKMDKLEQQKTLAQWQQEAYHNINKTFANFILDSQKAFGLVKSGIAGLAKQSVTSLDWVKSAVSGDKNILEASARADAVAGTYQLEVHQLATNWSAASGEKVGGTLALRAEEKLDFTINVNGKEIVIVKEGPREIKLADIAKEINQQAKDLGVSVSAQFDAGLGRFFFQTTDTGDGTVVLFDDRSNVDGKGFLAGEDNFLRLQSKDGEQIAFLENSVEYQGKNAIVDFGAAVGLEFSSNQFTLNGIAFDIKAEGKTSVTVSTDVDSVYNKIKDFIDQYNEMVSQVQNLLGEKKANSHLPLTAEQREQLSEKEIEKWEEIAKTGLLNRDIYLTQMLQTLRSGLYEKVKGTSGEYHLFSFGITTEQYVSGSMGGKLQIDEAKLKNAIKEDVNEVLELFFSQPDSTITDKGDKRAQTGIVSRIYEDLTEGMKSIINKAGIGADAALYRNVDSRMLLDFVVEQGSISFLQKDISRLDARITTFQLQMQKTESRYWAQFTALEKAINQMNAQSAWLAQQLGGGMR
ncbi:MAG: flagellar filament capping protein FliD [Bacillota bacterium]